MEEQIFAARSGDSEAFVTVMESYKPDLYRTARAILHNDADAADAMQETILICWQKIKRLRNPAFCKTWATRICINCCKKIQKQNQNIIYVDSYAGIEPIQEDVNIQEDLFQQVETRYAVILSLYYKGGYSIREIAQMMHMNENTVKTRLARGRTACRKCCLAENTGGI